MHNINICSITGKADLAEKYCRSFNSVYPSVCLPMCQNANLKRKLFLYLSMYLLYKYIINKLYYTVYRLYEIFIHSLLLTYKLLVLKPDNSGCLKTFSCVNIHVDSVVLRKIQVSVACIQNYYYLF